MANARRALNALENLLQVGERRWIVER